VPSPPQRARWERRSHPGRGASTPAAAQSSLRDDRSPGSHGPYPDRTWENAPRFQVFEYAHAR
jgi:hypothetical protein